MRLLMVIVVFIFSFFAASSASSLESKLSADRGFSLIDCAPETLQVCKNELLQCVQQVCSPARIAEQTAPPLGAGDFRVNGHSLANEDLLNATVATQCRQRCFNAYGMCRTGSSCDP